MNRSDKENRLVGVPSIEPVPEGVKRPLFSVMIPVYNPREDYLDLALRSVLDQDLGPDQMQIEVVDDGSTNGIPEKVVRRLSPDRISFIRRDPNVGLSRIWNLCIQRARGRLVHIFHQDDLVMPGFYQGIRDVFDQEPEIGAAFCQFSFIDENGNCLKLSSLEMKKPGILPHWLERIAVENNIQCPAVVVKRSVCEELGGFHPELVYNLDWEMWKRIAVRYPFGYVPRPLACWRVHSSSETSHLARFGLDTIDVCKSIDISRTYLPESISAMLTGKAKEHWAIYSINSTARDLFLFNDFADTFKRIYESLKCSHSQRVIETLARHFLWLLCVIARRCKDAIRKDKVIMRTGKGGQIVI
jgi:glycosyltransferase involved in cell wall biosynthesis